MCCLLGIVSLMGEKQVEVRLQLIKQDIHKKIVKYQTKSQKAIVI
ncbi:hypothetical protein FB550_10965 [Neobacillus bataviensis]|uniref:Uncharacterized protein n=1 Tax=Neobacillus bataviensis TaxID=220685 RepID=A0A561D540_9BACI|nr:hypothetical protein FB550_10965 [Neobacillus bataviensis]